MHGTPSFITKKWSFLAMNNYSFEFLQRRKHLLNGLALSLISEEQYLQQLKQLLKMEILGVLSN